MTHTDPKDIETPINYDEWEEESRQSPADTAPHRGFLPIETNWFDRIFISVVIWVALCLLWLRFVEPAGLSLNFAHAIAVLLGIFIVWKG
jgi:predicted small integral membrane protein